VNDHADEMARRIGAVFDAHPELEDHRRSHPWLVGWLGDPAAATWLISENPSATQIARIHSSFATPESQWAASRGDRLLREALVEHGLKTGSPFDQGGWRCYLTNVMKSKVFVKDWNGTPAAQQLRVAEVWAPVLRFELEVGHPMVVIVLGGKAERALRHLEKQCLVPKPPSMHRIDHYSYVMHRPDNRRGLGPGHPLRQQEWRAALGDAATTGAEGR
jgi:hypothetical protein